MGGSGRQLKRGYLVSRQTRYLGNEVGSQTSFAHGAGRLAQGFGTDFLRGLLHGLAHGSLLSFLCGLIHGLHSLFYGLLNGVLAGVDVVAVVFEAALVVRPFIAGELGEGGSFEGLGEDGIAE